MSAIAIPAVPLAARKPLRTYDHAAFNATIRPTDVFLCTYPKSGTTWLAYLIAQALKRDPDEQIDLKSMYTHVPDVNLLYTKRGSLEQYSQLPDPRIFLCHATFNERLPNVIYVIRDPRDALVSYWHYQRFLHKGYDRSLADFIAADDHWPCEWDQHVASWLLPRRHPNFMLVRYEQLHEDAAGVLRDVLRFAGKAFTEERIAAAVASSRFDRMRATEETHGVHGKAGDEDARFVRKGRAGGWRQEMSGADLRILEDKYGEVMRQVRYEPTTR
ncbi:MAG TPA: sulfotransferase domain-containing protein [Humisphaera sp.]|jgi:hypothetical protein|nr:sulfotransferase domain-containing protein [Humisphaera sp.]